MNRILIIAAVATGTLALSACELAPKTSIQNGYRGTGMNTIKVAATEAAEEVPDPPYAPPGTEGERAGAVYQNVQVLGDVSVDQFNYTMAALTEWVSPAEGCNYCHNPANMASDEVYTKIVARRMIQMTRALNANWSNHVGNTGVTCWTCHRGEPVPEESWTLPVAQRGGIVGNRSGQNEPVSNSAYSSLPTAAVARYLLGGSAPGEDIRVVSKTSRPTPANRLSTMDTEHSYALMMHISQALGVNCTYCHNAQSFQTWASSNPPRQTSWYGVRMVRDINQQYITPLTNVFPANRKGELGDPYKVNCTTCHRGQNKPMGGFPMARDYPALRSASPSAIPLSPAAPAAEGLPVASARPVARKVAVR
jgi:photosynthetic reaction center cytochrome c subunit